MLLDMLLVCIHNFYHLINWLVRILHIRLLLRHLDLCDLLHRLYWLHLLNWLRCRLLQRGWSSDVFSRLSEAAGTAWILIKLDTHHLLLLHWLILLHRLVLLDRLLVLVRRIHVALVLLTKCLCLCLRVELILMLHDLLLRHLRLLLEGLVHLLLILLG